MLPADLPPPPPVIREFAPPPQPWAAGHRGVDLAVTPGAVVRALAPGTVGFVGQVGGKPVVTVRLTDGRRVTYEPVAAIVAVGDEVRVGTALGIVGSDAGHCGSATGCLHVGLRRGAAYLDPAQLWAPRAAVLKPA